MASEHEDRGSIWASRTSLDTGMHSLVPRRARAGTLPSRLPSRLDTSRDSQLPHLGSLALISPDGTDIVYDVPPPCSRSAVGQRPSFEERRRSPPLAPIYEPDNVEKRAHLGPQVSTAPSLAPPSVRTRSGSMNSAVRPHGPYPFGSSIWTNQPSQFSNVPNVPNGPNVASPMPNVSNGMANGLSSSLSNTLSNGISSGLNGLHGSNTGMPTLSSMHNPNSLSMGSAGSLSNLSSGLSSASSFSSEREPMSVFSNELNKTSSPARLRSGTLDSQRVGGQNGTSDWHSMHALPRSRAQTLIPAKTSVHSDMLVGEYSATPTPAICVSNVPPHTAQIALLSLFSSFGKIETAQVVPSKAQAYVVFASTIQAIEAQATANGAELFVGSGRSTVFFSKLSPQVAQQPDVPVTSAAPVSVAYILQTLNADREEMQSGVEHLQRAAKLVFDAPICSLNESLSVDPGSADRAYHAAVLRDLRRRLDSMPTKEVEEVALDMQRELPALASDYIGNTAVQLVYERSGQDVRDMMLRRMADVFAATGTHKNGTWAVQKMIDLAAGPRHYALIERAIQPHLVALLLDQFGNYVVQGCLKFGAPYNDFVYSGIAATLGKIAPNRFGARAVRAVLESEHTTAVNQRLVATAIIQQIASLATNPNGCLLVSWLLDNFERSDPDMHLRTHSLVAAQLIPQHLAVMCSSKLGSGIVLKLAASPSSSSNRVFDALLQPMTDRLPTILVEVLEDSSGQGASCVFRLMTTIFPPQSLERQVTLNKVRMCLLRPGARIPNHKRLLEEVGLNMLHPEVKEARAMGGLHSQNSSDELPVIHSHSDPSIAHMEA